MAETTRSAFEIEYSISNSSAEMNKPRPTHITNQYSEGLRKYGTISAKKAKMLIKETG
jgi:hypothetical protein